MKPGRVSIVPSTDITSSSPSALFGVFKDSLSPVLKELHVVSIVFDYFNDIPMFHIQNPIDLPSGFIINHYFMHAMFIKPKDKDEKKKEAPNSAPGGVPLSLYRLFFDPFGEKFSVKKICSIDLTYPVNKDGKMCEEDIYSRRIVLHDVNEKGFSFGPEGWVLWKIFYFFTHAIIQVLRKEAAHVIPLSVKVDGMSIPTFRIEDQDDYSPLIFLSDGEAVDFNASQVFRFSHERQKLDQMPFGGDPHQTLVSTSKEYHMSWGHALWGNPWVHMRKTRDSTESDGWWGCEFPQNSAPSFCNAPFARDVGVCRYSFDPEDIRFGLFSISDAFKSHEFKLFPTSLAWKNHTGIATTPDGDLAIFEFPKSPSGESQIVPTHRTTNVWIYRLNEDQKLKKNDRYFEHFLKKADS